MKKQLIFLFFFLVCLLWQPVYAQKKPQNTKVPPPTAGKSSTQVLSPEAMALKVKFEEFIDAYANIEKTKAKHKVLGYMSNEVISTLVSFNLSGKMNILYSDYKGFTSYLEKLTTTEGLSINYVLENIDKIYVNGNIAMVVYGVNYENKKGGQIWSKGHETVSLTYKKVLGEWKICQYVVTQIEDEKTKVSCICELSAENNAQDFAVKTTIPSGRSYQTELSPVGFMYPENAKMIVIGEKYYKWLPNGDINYLEEPTEAEAAIKETNIGKVADQNNRQQAIELVLTKHYYKNVCSEVQISTNKK
jgi:hypothetical protein